LPSLRNCLTIALLAISALSAKAQKPLVDVGLSFDATRSLQNVSAQNFWMEGGSAEFGVDAWHGLGFAANITGVHGSSIGSSGVPLSLITAAAGPRFRARPGRSFSWYAQFLAGRANGFDSIFPATGGAQSSASSLALQAGGGVDIRVNQRFAIRAIEASWLRTQLPNGTTNVQNTLVLGSGLVFRFGR
jgi:hypothetical protein